MKKLILITLILLNAIINVNAQGDRIIDSLKNELILTKSDTTRALLLVNLAANFRYSNLDSSVIYAKQGYELSKKIDFPFGESRALGYESIALVWLGDLPAALKKAFKALEIAERNKDENEGLSLNVIGMVYFELADYKTAASYFRRQLGIYRNTTRRTALASEAYALTDLGETLTYLGELDSAILYQNKSIDAFQRIGVRVDPLVYIRLGSIEVKKNNLEQAKDYFHKSLIISIGNNERRAISQAYVNLAKLYKGLNILDSAIHYAKAGISVAESISQKKIMYSSTVLLAEMYEQLEPYSALTYYKRADSIKSSMLGAGNLQSIQALITKEEQRQRELNEAEASFQNRLQMNALMGSTFTLVVIVFFVIRNNRVQKKSKRKTEIAYERLQTTQTQLIQSEKMASLGELTAGIAHEIQNPLNFVNNFSEVNAELIRDLKSEIENGNLEEVKAIANDIESNEEKIVHHGKRADGIVKGMLQHSRASSGQKEPTDINVLCDEYLRLSYHGLRAKDKTFNAKFETDFDTTIPNINVVPQDIGRVVLNLINNAFYAVSSKAKSSKESNYEPTVSVDTRKEGANISISVKDNGNGIPDSIKDKIFQPFFTTKPTGQGTGLGLSLSYDIVKAHEGELLVDSEIGVGTQFKILLPSESE